MTLITATLLIPISGYPTPMSGTQNINGGIIILTAKGYAAIKSTLSSQYIKYSRSNFFAVFFTIKNKNNSQANKNANEIMKLAMDGLDHDQINVFRFIG